MSDLYGSPMGGGGLMGMLANPQTAGLLGMAGGLLQASGPSRLPISNGQALGMGLQGMGEGFNNALQMQRGLMQMKMLQGLMGDQGGAAPQPQGMSAPTSASQPMAPVSGSANVGPLSGLSAGMGGFSPTPAASAASASAAFPATAPSGAMLMGKTPAQMFHEGQMWNLLSPGSGNAMIDAAFKYDPTLQASLPTDITKMGTQAGWTPQQIQAANAGGIARATTITGRPGGYSQDLTSGKMTWFPTVPQGGMPQFDANNQFTGVVPVPGATSVESGMAAAKAGGKAQYELQQVWDKTANDGKGGFVYQKVANVADAANGNDASQVPTGIRNNNFGNIKGANGQFATYDTPQDGVNAADQLLATYGSKYGINTIAGIANRWAPAGDGNNDPAAKAAAMAAASGVPANQPINLADPATRARILPALFDTETPGWRNAIGGGGQSAPAPTRTGPMAAQPPVGYTPATNAAQTASSKQMADSYKALADSDASYQQSRGALNDMIALAKQFGPIDSGLSKLPEGAHNWDSNVASYDKAHATFVSNQYNALSAGTDASKGTVDSMVPSSDKPLDTKLHGLGMQLNNLDYRHLETQLMTPAFQSGDQKAYTTLNAQFHNTVKPEMMPIVMPILQMNGTQQQAAVQAAVKANPALRPAFQTLFNAGMLK